LPHETAQPESIMNIRRLIQLIALVMIGDGVIGTFKPRRHSLLWDIGPGPFRNMMETLAANPGKARLLYGAEILLGAWLAERQTPGKVELV
jgi:hypothetical protein